MQVHSVIQNLSKNKHIFENQLKGNSKEEYLWKPGPDKWCMLEVICHLIDEEREDFRARVKHVLEHPDTPFKPIDPVNWVIDRDYINQNYEEKITLFLKERTDSITWLTSLKNAPWENAYDHHRFGKMTGSMLLANWLAHDYIHIRQILRLKNDYFRSLTTENLTYAGNW